MRKFYLITIVLCLLFLSGSIMAFDLTEMGLKSAESYDLAGNTVTIISWTGSRMENYFKEDPVVKGRLAKAERLFNCKIKFLQTRDIPSTNIARLMAGDSTYDIWNTQSRIGYYELVSQGAAYPMGDVLSQDYYNSLTNLERQIINMLKFKKKTYGIGTTHYGGGLWNLGSVVLFYNKDMIAEEGLADPYELYKNDQWNWDAMTKIMTAVTKDIDGDGFYDQWGIPFIREITMAVANGAKVTTEDENGSRSFVFDQAAAIETLEQIKKWNDMGVNGGSDHEAFQNGQTAFYMVCLNTGAELMNLDLNWGIVPLPKGPHSERYYFPLWAPETCIIPANAKQPEALAALRAFLFRADDIPVNLVLSRYVKDRNAAELFMEIQNNWQGECRYLLEKFGGEDLYNIIYQIMNGEKTAKVAMDEIKPVIKAKINDLYK